VGLDDRNKAIHVGKRASRRFFVFVCRHRGSTWLCTFRIRRVSLGTPIRKRYGKKEGGRQANPAAFVFVFDLGFIAAFAIFIFYFFIFERAMPLALGGICSLIDEAWVLTFCVMLPVLYWLGGVPTYIPRMIWAKFCDAINALQMG